MNSTVPVILVIVLVIFVILTFTNVLCSPLDLCYKSELGNTCFQAKSRTATNAADLARTPAM